MVVHKKLAKLFELAPDNCINSLGEHAVILGFSKLNLNLLSENRLGIDALICPVKNERRCIEKTQRVNIDVHHLGYLTSRMHIVNGTILGRQVKQKMKLNLFFPSEGFPKVVPFSQLPIQATNSLLKFKEYFPDFFESNYVLLEGSKGGGEKPLTVAVSCAEILRFYYPHTSLVEAALSEREASLSIYNPDIPVRENNRPFVQLRKRIPDLCAPHAARIRHSSHAERAFNLIYERTIHSRPLDNHDDRYLNVLPPISGDVSWVVEANQISDDFILINGIYQCDAKFPFEELLFGRDNDGRRPPDSPKPEKLNFIPKKQAIFDGENHIEDLDQVTASLEAGADLQIETLKIEFDFENCAPNFDFLQSLQVKKIEKVSLKNPAEMNISVLSGIEAVAGVVSSGYIDIENKNKFANAEVSTGVIKKSLVEDEWDSLSFQDAFNVFQEAANRLKSEYIVNWRKASVWRIPTKSSFYLNAFLPKDASNNSFLLLSKKGYTTGDYLEKFIHSRKFVIAELCCGERYIYLVDFEKRKVISRDEQSYSYESSSVLLFFGEHGEYLSNAILKEEILQYAESRSTWSNGETRIKLNHKHNVAMFTDRIRRKVGEVFSKWDKAGEDRLTSEIYDDYNTYRNLE